MALTPSRTGDSPVRPDLLDQVPRTERIGPGTADGAQGTRRCRTAILERGATAFVGAPVHRTGA